MKHLPLLLLLCFPLTGCLVSKKEHDKILEENRILKDENKILKVENEELQNGEERSAARIENLFEEGNLSDTKRMIERFFEYHPHSSYVAKFERFLEEIELKEIEIAERKAAEEKERIRLANINNTGNWYVGSFYAELPKVNGSFDNSATENSRCTMEFRVTDEQRVEMRIYEYAGTNPLKATYSSPDVYRVYVWHGEKIDGGARELDSFSAKNTSKYLEVDEEGSNFIIQKLLEEKSLGLWIDGTEYNQNSKYRFELEDFEYFENALRKLLGE